VAAIACLHSPPVAASRHTTPRPLTPLAPPLDPPPLAALAAPPSPGFFVSKDKYTNKEPGEEEQNGDPLWVAFKELAKDQSWMSDLGMGHKTWTFGYGHDKTVANEAGCEDVGTYTWDHACIVVWKTSPDGSHLRAWHTSHFDKDFSKSPKPVPTVDDIKKFVRKTAGNKVGSQSTTEL
jgi:hypothetical protein